MVEQHIIYKEIIQFNIIISIVAKLIIPTESSIVHNLVHKEMIVNMALLCMENIKVCTDMCDSIKEVTQSMQNITCDYQELNMDPGFVTQSAMPTMQRPRQEDHKVRPSGIQSKFKSNLDELQRS
jgi:hypothetical protein